jgi:hypothetical protein
LVETLSLINLHRRLFPVLIGALIVVALMGCSGDAEPELTDEVQLGPTAETVRSGSTGSVEESPLNTTVVPASARFVELLSQIPSTVENREEIWLNDFLPIWSAWDSLGATRPTDESGNKAMDRFYSDLAFSQSSSGVNLFARPRLSSPRISGFDIAGAITNSYESLGFDQRNIDGSAMAGPNQRPLELIVGDLDTSAITTALLDCTRCRDHLAVEYEGETYYSWGPELIGDLDDRFAQPMFDHSGRGSRMFFHEGIVMRSLMDDQITSVVDVAVGSTPSVFDVEEFQLATDAHGIAGSYSAWFSDQPFDMSGATRAASNLNNGLPPTRALETLRQQPLLDKFDLVSVGWGVDTGTAYATIVIINPNEATALRNAELLVARIKSGDRVGREGSWAELVDRVEIGTSGRAVIARLIPHPDQVLLTISHLEIAYTLPVFE